MFGTKIVQLHNISHLSSPTLASFLSDFVNLPGVIEMYCYLSTSSSFQTPTCFSNNRVNGNQPGV